MSLALVFRNIKAILSFVSVFAFVFFIHILKDLEWQQHTLPNLSYYTSDNDSTYPIHLGSAGLIQN